MGKHLTPQTKTYYKNKKHKMRVILAAQTTAILDCVVFSLDTLDEISSEISAILYLLFALS